jgi:hypothetical protein
MYFINFEKKRKSKKVENRINIGKVSIKRVKEERAQRKGTIGMRVVLVRMRHVNPMVVKH